MEHHFPDYLKGYVRVRIVGNSYDRFLNLCAFHRIRLWDLLPAGEAYEACISNQDFRRLKAIVRKCHVSIRVTKRYGLPFFVHRYRKRKVYVLGIAASMLFMFWLSAHIWKITVDGNLTQTDDVIFEYLQENGIRHGMRKSGVDCKTLAAELRNYFTGFSWVAVDLAGTRLQIHVKEGSFAGQDMGGNRSDGDRGASENVALEPSNLVASGNGTLVSVYVRKGLPQAEIGDTIEPGQILVTGALPVYNDSGEVSSYQYVAADADIVIRMERPYQDALPVCAGQKFYTGREKNGYLIQLGELPLAFPVSFAGLSSHDVTGTVKQLRLMENFYLPLYIKTYTAREYEYRKIRYTKEELESLLNSNLQIFMKNLEEKGVQIFENDVKIEWTETSAIAAGTLITGEPAVRRAALADSEEELSKHEYG